MKRRTMARTGLAALAAVSLGVAGCNSAAGDNAADKGGATAAGDPADARQALVDAAAKLRTTTFKITLSTGGFSGSGVVDPEARSSQVSLGGGDTAMTIEVRMIQHDLWMKVPGLPVGDGTWMHLDIAKLAADSRLNALGTADDPGGTQAMVKAITEVKSLGGGRYQGTLDLSKSSSSRFLTDRVDEQGLGADALRVPFEATVDDQGRLTSLTVDQSELVKKVGGEAGAGIAAAAGTVEMTFSDFGVEVTVQAPPAGEVTELPAEVLKALGG